MLDAWRTAFSDPWFWTFPVATTFISMFAFLLFALPMTWIAVRDVARFSASRIQTRRASSKPTVWPSIKSWLINNAWMLLGVFLIWPLLRMSHVHAGPMPPVWRIAIELLAFVYLDDFLYYWMHRAMHSRWLYKHVHSKHHRITAPWAITGHFMHPMEYVLTGGLALVGPLLFGSHIVTVWIWVVMRQWEAAEGHAGYDFSWSPTKLLPGSDGALHHDFHHAKVKGNYGGFLPIWDRVFGTLAAGYAEHRRRDS